LLFFLSKCQNKNGGFGGGPDQISHLAPTYAAINALIMCGTEYAYNIINREKMLEFLLDVKQENGGFIMHKGGESDLRGSYCAMSVASVLNILTSELVKGVGEYIARCQTFEGGVGAEPGNEAHGGYTFCAISALLIINKTYLINQKRLLEWCIQRQMNYEGGFQGRTNKLVDACYSFWQGGLFPLIHTFIQYQNEDEERWLFRQKSLQEYILLCCQDENGGIIDKPGKNRDYYHTCYGLSGLSIAQHNTNSAILNDNASFNHTVVGSSTNLLQTTDAIWNLDPLKLKKAMKYFNEKQY